MYPQHGELRPTNGWHLLASLGNPSKFQHVSCLGFITAAMSLNRGQPNFEQCLAVSWTGSLYIHFPGLLPATEFCFVLYWQRYSTALEQWASVKVCSVVQGLELRNFHRGRHVYSAGPPSRWASAHILLWSKEFRSCWSSITIMHYQSRLLASAVLTGRRRSRLGPAVNSPLLAHCRLVLCIIVVSDIAIFVLKRGVKLQLTKLCIICRPHCHMVLWQDEEYWRLQKFRLPCNNRIPTSVTQCHFWGQYLH